MLFQLQTTERLGAEQDHAARLLTPPESPLSRAPSHRWLGLAKGPRDPAIGSPNVLAGDADLDTGSASAAAAPPRQEESLKPPPVGGRRVAKLPSIPEMPAAAPPVQTRLPLGGAAAASGGAPGSVAPPVVGELEGLALVLAAILLARFSVDRATWRSAMLVWRLEHPG